MYQVWNFVHKNLGQKSQPGGLCWEPNTLELHP